MFRRETSTEAAMTTGMERHEDREVLPSVRLIGEPITMRLDTPPPTGEPAAMCEDGVIGFTDPLRLFAAVAAATPLATFVKDLHGRYRFANPAATALTRYEPSAFLGRTDAELFPPEYAAAHEASDREVARDGITLRMLVELAVDNDRRVVDCTKSPFHDEAGRVVGVILVKQDVTETHHLEARLRHAQKMDAVGRLAATVAHDFNNVLTGIMGFAELLLQSFSSTDPRADDAREIVAASERGRAVVRELLTFSRRQEPRPQRVTLDAIVDGVLPLLRKVAGPRVTVTRRGSDGGLVSVDTGLLEQVVVNLVANARDATLAQHGDAPAPEILLRTGMHTNERARLVRSGTLAPGRYAFVSVADRGTGMTDETLARLFEPFYTTKPSGQGTGLGLSTAYGIVVQSGGGIHATTSPGRGSTFTVLLPIVEDGRTRPTNGERA